MKGPPPKPTALKKLQGNPGRQKLNKSEPKMAGSTTAPRWLDPIARAEWRRLAPRLNRLELLTPADRALLASYCRAYSRLVQAERFLQKAGSLMFRTAGGALKPWPAEAIANQAADTLRKVAAEFGLTPASRSRISIAETNPKSQAAAFLFGEAPNADECQADDVN